jgi:hypothetical protein
MVVALTAAAPGAIAGAVFALAGHSVHDVATFAIACLSLLALLRWNVPEPVIVALSGVADMLLFSSIGSK